MLYNDIHFNHEFYKGKKYEDFVKNEKHHGLSAEQMKEAFDKMQKYEEPKETKAKEKVVTQVVL